MFDGIVGCKMRWRDGVRNAERRLSRFPRSNGNYFIKNSVLLWWLLSDTFCCRSTRCPWRGNLCHLWIFRQHDLYLEYREAHLHRHKVCGVCEEVGSSLSTVTRPIPPQFSQGSASSRDPRNQPLTLNTHSHYPQFPNYDLGSYQILWAINIFIPWCKVFNNLSNPFIHWQGPNGATAPHSFRRTFPLHLRAIAFEGLGNLLNLSNLHSLYFKVGLTQNLLHRFVLII